jgi:protein kinase C substrate 80K-H
MEEVHSAFGLLSDVQGAGCWQGPNRSVTLKISCGQRTEITAVEEPSRCTYAARLKSPVLCTPDVIIGVRQEIDVLLSGSWDQPSESAAPHQEDL